MPSERSLLALCPQGQGVLTQVLGDRRGEIMLSKKRRRSKSSSEGSIVASANTCHTHLKVGRVKKEAMGSLRKLTLRAVSVKVDNSLVNFSSVFKILSLCTCDEKDHNSAVHKLPGKSSYNVGFVFTVCPAHNHHDHHDLRPP